MESEGTTLRPQCRRTMASRKARGGACFGRLECWLRRGEACLLQTAVACLGFTGGRVPSGRQTIGNGRPRVESG